MITNLFGLFGFIVKIFYKISPDNTILEFKQEESAIIVKEMFHNQVLVNS
jgi:hypothetical protein